MTDDRKLEAEVARLEAANLKLKDLLSEVGAREFFLMQKLATARRAALLEAAEMVEAKGKQLHKEDVGAVYEANSCPSVYEQRAAHCWQRAGALIGAADDLRNEAEGDE